MEAELEWQIVLALVLAIPVVLIPAAIVWYLVIGGVFNLARAGCEKRQAARNLAVVPAKPGKVVDSEV